MSAVKPESKDPWVRGWAAGWYSLESYEEVEPGPLPTDSDGDRWARGFASGRADNDQLPMH